jgi:tetratricopeptide (TPR) repeat protein
VPAPRKKKGATGRLNPPQETTKPKAPSLSRGKLWRFRLMAVLGIPIVLLGLLELSLRLAGFGYPTAFLLPSRNDGHAVFVQNNRFGWRFFGPVMARLPQPLCISETKNPNSVRIVVLGESAAMGDPDPRFGLPRMLQAVLELRYPDTNFEVVNACVVAINSNVILPIAEDCAKKAKSDIWVIYMGNNEVVGPFGAGTVFGQQVPPLSLIRANLALKSTCIGQSIETLFSKINKPPENESEWGGMEMFLKQQVRADDSRMPRVYEHFSKNLSDIILAGRNSGASVVVSTVAVNLIDSAPFASEHRLALSKTDADKWEQLYRSGVTAQDAGKIDEASNLYREAAQLDDSFADLRFRQGSCALASGNTTEAQKQFIAARDLDTLRFRCDSKSNDAIRQTVANRSDARVILADAEQAFAEHSKDGLPGNELFYEHVHLTFHGNYLLALTLASRVQGLLPAKVAARFWPSETDCARRLAWSDWNKQKSLADVFTRLNDPPFVNQLNHNAQIRELVMALQQLASAPKPPGIQAAKASCENAVIAAPDDPILREQLAQLNEAANDLAAAETNEQVALRWLPNSSQDWSELGVILVEQKKYDPATDAFRRAFELNPEDVMSLQNLAQALKNLGRRDDAIRDYRHALALKPRFGVAWLGLGQVLEEAGNKVEAEKCYQNALRNPLRHAPELASLARFCVARGWRDAAATNYEAAIKLSPFDASLHVEAAMNLTELGRSAAAEQHCAEAIQLEPNSIEAHFLYGLCLGHDGNPAGAAAQFREAVRIMPDMLEAHLNLGIALTDEKNYSDALEQFNQVLQRNPNHATALQYVRAIKQKLSQMPSGEDN